MLIFIFPYLLSLCILDTMRTQAQQRSTILFQPILDVSILISTDEPDYFPDDTLHLTIQREGSKTTARATPIVAIEGMKLKSTGHDTHLAVIPQIVPPGSYRILFRIIDAKCQRFVYEKGRGLPESTHHFLTSNASRIQTCSAQRRWVDKKYPH
jgi:hypothetical protein